MLRVKIPLFIAGEYMLGMLVVEADSSLKQVKLIINWLLFGIDYLCYML